MINHRFTGQHQWNHWSRCSGIRTAMLIARKDVQIKRQGKEKFTYLNTGIHQFGHYQYTGNVRIEQAQVASSKAAYLAATMLSGTATGLRKF